MDRSLAGYSPHGCKESDPTEGILESFTFQWLVLLLLLSSFSRVRVCVTP